MIMIITDFKKVTKIYFSLNNYTYIINHLILNTIYFIKKFHIKQKKCLTNFLKIFLTYFFNNII